MSADGKAPAADFKVGLLGHGTVGSAFAALLAERAGEIARFNGQRPVISGVLTRSSGSFQEILSEADLLVELIGGIEPARENLEQRRFARAVGANQAQPLAFGNAERDAAEQDP